MSQTATSRPGPRTRRRDAARGRAFVLAARPRQRHADPKLYPPAPVRRAFDGFQTIAPGGRVREHSHGDQVELQICFRGKGRVWGTARAIRWCPAPLLPRYDVRHELINETPRTTW